MIRLNSSFSIKTILSVIAVLIIAINSGVVIFSTLNANERLAQKVFQRYQEYVATNISADLLSIIVEPNPDEIAVLEALLRLDVYPEVAFASVVDRSNKVLGVYRGKSYKNDIDISPFFQMKPNESIVERKLHNGVLLPIGNKLDPVGFLILTHDFSDALNDNKVLLFKSVTPTVIFSLIFMCILSVWIMRRFLKPLSSMAFKMQSVTKSNDYGTSVPEVGAREVRTLASAFNNMLIKIKEQIIMIESSNASLLKQRDLITFTANHDQLTKLPNRRNAVQTIQKWIETQDKDKDIVLFMLGNNGVADTATNFGLRIADRMLKIIVTRVSEIISNDVFFARFEGNEFLLVFKNNYSNEELIKIAEKIVNSLTLPIHVEQWTVYAYPRIGISRLSGCSLNVDTLIKHADMAKNSYAENPAQSIVVYSDKLKKEEQRKAEIAALISQSIDKQEFTLHYQPRVSLNENIISFEALVRWESLKLGWVSPAEFIPIAEQSGDITKLSSWVVRQACLDIEKLKEKIQDKKVCVSINLSTLDIQDVSFIENSLAVVENMGIDFESIEFEITETAYLSDPKAAQHFSQRVREKGCHVALDDFGTGYSSLSYLTKIDFDTLKIDRSFVIDINKDIRANLVITSIIEMAKRLNLQICAEGVETAEQANFLIQSGCDQLQGYLFSKPLPIKLIYQEENKYAETLDSVFSGVDNG